MIILLANHPSTVIWLISFFSILTLFVFIVSSSPSNHGVFRARVDDKGLPPTLMMVACRRGQLLHHIVVDVQNMRNNDTFVFPVPRSVLVDQAPQCTKITLDKNTHFRFQLYNETISRKLVKETVDVFCEALPDIRVVAADSCHVTTLSRVDVSLIAPQNRSNKEASKMAYSLHLNTNEISISAYSFAGLSAALGSLYQILLSPKPLFLPLIIKDDTENAWRGLMIDVARHFIPVRLLERTIHAMWLTKLNVLHLHLTDSQVEKGLFSFM